MGLVPIVSPSYIWAYPSSSMGGRTSRVHLHQSLFWCAWCTPSLTEKLCGASIFRLLLLVGGKAAWLGSPQDPSQFDVTYTAGSHPCSGCVLASANCMPLSRKQKVCSNSSELQLTTRLQCAYSKLRVQQSFCANELSSCAYIIVIVTRKVIKHVVDVSSPGAAGCTGRWIFEMQLERSSR